MLPQVAGPSVFRQLHIRSSLDDLSGPLSTAETPEAQGGRWLAQGCTAPVTTPNKPGLSDHTASKPRIWFIIASLSVGNDEKEAD